MQDLSDRLAALTPERRTLLEARLRERGLSAPKPNAIRPIPGRDQLAYFPASLDQERLWFVDQMEPGNPAYNIHTSTRMQGPMDVEKMRRAINACIARHEVLRTTFAVVDGRPVQVVAPSLQIDLPVIDLEPVPEAEREAAALRTAIEAAAVRFDMQRGPLFQARLARLGPEDHVLMICMQHAITDRWSFDIFERELAEIYVALRDGRVPPEFPALEIQFADFAAWQRRELSGQSLERHLAYWRDKLARAPLVLEIPTDHPRPPVQTFSGAREYIIYPEALLFELKEITQRAGATMFMTMLAALHVLCWKYSGQRDLVIGSAMADRNRPETENVIGYFLNMLLLRATIDPSMSFRTLLAQVRDTALGAYAHQDVPFATLVAELKPRQDPSRNPLIQVSFIYLDFPMPGIAESVGFSAVRSLDVDNGASRFDMTLACTELMGTGIHSYIEYNSDLYEKPKVDRMLQHLGRILEWFSTHPDAPLAALEMLSEDERPLWLDSLPAAGIASPAPCIHEQVAAAAAQWPEATALVFDGAATTFAALEAGAQRVASTLRARGVGPESLVPVAAGRSVEQAIALLGVLEAGAAYVPLDPSLPAERIEAMLREVRPSVVLAAERWAAAVPECGATLVRIQDALARAAPGKQEARACRATPEQLAYVMFTSGSTGVPKGVMVSHRAIGNRLEWAQAQYPLQPGDIVLHNASFGFDIAVWELFGALAAGATVVIANEHQQKDPAALVQLMRDTGVTIAHFVPSMLRACLDAGGLGRCETLRAVFCGGEGMDRELHDRFFRALPNRALAHFYGPTEAAISCLYHDCAPHLAPGAVPIGVPIANMRAVLLDSTWHPVPAGVPAEIALGGVGLARGYLGRPDLTAEHFRPDPVSGEPGQRVYWTGDRAKRREDGRLEFLGRADHQIKLRGYRIEPGEIETILESLPGIERAVAVARGAIDARRLVAYVTLDEKSPAPSEPEMRAALRRALPEYMVPAAFVVLPQLPLGSNGKVDRSALPEPGAAPSSDQPVEPRTPVERTIAEIWAPLLGRERMSVEDDFFDLGGDSLLATQVMSRVRVAFEIELPLRRFFEGSTVAALAMVVEDLLVEKLESMPESEVAEWLERAGGSVSEA